MSLNQIINPIIPLDLHVAKLTYVSPLPKIISEVYTITSDDLVKQKLLMITTSSSAIIVTFPSITVLSLLLPKVGDFLEVKIKYRTLGSVTVNSVDNLFFVLFGNSYTLPPSNGTVFTTQTIGIGRITATGTNTQDNAIITSFSSFDFTSPIPSSNGFAFTNTSSFTLNRIGLQIEQWPPNITQNIPFNIYIANPPNPTVLFIQYILPRTTIIDNHYILDVIPLNFPPGRYHVSIGFEPGMGFNTTSNLIYSPIFINVFGASSIQPNGAFNNNLSANSLAGNLYFTRTIQSGSSFRIY